MEQNQCLLIVILIVDKDSWAINQLYLDKLPFFDRCSDLETENSRARVQSSIQKYSTLEAITQTEETRRHRFSALVDGICIGVGVVFILLGVLMPITSADMLVQGLMSVIGGLVVLVVGLVVEVYNWAKLN